MTTFKEFLAEGAIDLELESLCEGEIIVEAEYQGKTVELNKPKRGGSKKFYVYVKNDKGNVIKISFGDKNMEIKRDSPARRKAFRDRHDCANKTDRTTAGYWACKTWEKEKSVSDIVD